MSTAAAQFFRRERFLQLSLTKVLKKSSIAVRVGIFMTPPCVQVSQSPAVHLIIKMTFLSPPHSEPKRLHTHIHCQNDLSQCCANEPLGCSEKDSGNLLLPLELNRGVTLWPVADKGGCISCASHELCRRPR